MQRHQLLPCTSRLLHIKASYTWGTCPQKALQHMSRDQICPKRCRILQCGLHRATGQTMCKIVGKMPRHPELSTAMVSFFTWSPEARALQTPQLSCREHTSTQSHPPACMGLDALHPLPSTMEFKSEETLTKCLFLKDPWGLGDAGSASTDK